MKIEFKEKPSKELLEKFCKRIEYFLSAHDLSIKIELWNTALRVESYVNKIHTRTTYFWVKKCIVNAYINSKQIKDLEVRLFNQGIDKEIDDGKIWTDAHHIQDQLYEYFQINPGNPAEGDPYWDLWKPHPYK